MENKTKTFPQQVREKYGDTCEQFAKRIGVTASTVKSWECGFSTPPGVTHALINTAHNHKLPTASDKKLAQLATPEQVKEFTARLMKGYGDNVTAFSRRLGVKRGNVERWLYDGDISKSGKVLLLTIALHPDWFVIQPSMPEPIK